MKTTNVSKKEPTKRVRINTSISGDACEILLELKRRGIVTSNTDAVIQALFALHEKILDRDLRLARLKALREVGE